MMRSIARHTSSRRVARAGFSRLLAAAALTAALTTLLAACGASGGGGTSPTPAESSPASSTAPASPTPTQTASNPATPTSGARQFLYFIRGGSLGVAERDVPQTSAPATAAVQALLAGPSSSEQAAGLSTSIPSGTTLRRLRIAGGTATVDLSTAFAQPASSTSVTRRVAEVVYTLTRFRTVRRVVVEVDGAALTEIPDASESATPVPIASSLRRTAPWSDLEPPIFVEDPGVGGIVSSPLALAGTASVFEGTFTAEVRQADGARLARRTVQATQGAPGRGAFSASLPFSTSATAGFLVVYQVSMENGSKQDIVRIPVAFAQQP